MLPKKPPYSPHSHPQYLKILFSQKYLKNSLIYFLIIIPIITITPFMIVIISTSYYSGSLVETGPFTRTSTSSLGSPSVDDQHY